MSKEKLTVEEYLEVKEFRVSGFVEEVGACQVDVKAENEESAKSIAKDEYDFYKVTGVDKLEGGEGNF